MDCACLRGDAGLTRVCMRVRIVCRASSYGLSGGQGAYEPFRRRPRPGAGAQKELGGELVLTASRSLVCGQLLGFPGRLRGRGRLGLMSSGLDRPSPACNCTGPGDYRSDLRAWPRPPGRLADGGRWREAHGSSSCNGSEPPWAVTDVWPGRDSGPRGKPFQFSKYLSRTTFVH